MVIWFIGLSGSGKTTLAHALTKKFRNTHKNVVLLDGDIMRELWGDSPGHDIDGRNTNARRISHLCKFLDEQGIIVIASVLSIFPEWQKWNRDNFESYYEIFLDIPMEILKARDTKKLYSRAEKGEINNVVGVDIKFPTPPSPDFIVTEKMQEVSPEKTLEIIVNSLDIKKIIQV